jgi:hypothetical protein
MQNWSMRVRFSAMSIVRRALFLAGLVAQPLLAGCGGSSSAAPRDATQESIASADARLRGRWVLVGYKPDIPLEPTLAMLLSTQFEHMTITFDGNRMLAEGPGINVTRKYRIREAYGDHFRAEVSDEFGVAYDSSNDFTGNLLQLRALTDPWRGTGTLRRLP